MSSIYAIYNNQSFNNGLINNIVSFEQLDPDHLLITTAEGEKQETEKKTKKHGYTVNEHFNPEQFTSWLKTSAEYIWTDVLAFLFFFRK